MSMDRVKLAKVLYHVAGVVAGQAKTSVGHRAGYCRLASAVGISPTSALVQRAIYKEAKYESWNTSEANAESGLPSFKNSGPADNNEYGPSQVSEGSTTWWMHCHGECRRRDPLSWVIRDV